MMNNKFILAMVLLCLVVCCLISGCTRKISEQSESGEKTLTVFLAAGMDQYGPVSALLDAEARADLEQKLGTKIAVKRVEIIDPGEAEAFDLFLFDQPTWIIQMADNARIRPLTVQAQSGEESYGKYKGSQYGYVFLGSRSVKLPKLLVLPDALEKAGIREIPFTPEAFSDALKTLSEEFVIPLAVSGEPTGSSFSPLLNLFGISPSGGNEFCIEGGTVSYDKLSPRMEEYLSWLRSIYLDYLVPEDMLVLSEYSMINMLNNISAMAVFSSDLYLNEAVRTLVENGKRVAAAEIPLPQEKSEIAVNRRLIGTVGQECQNTENAEKLLQMLAERDERLSDNHSDENIEIYPLFSQNDAPDFPEIYDLFSENEMVLTYRYQITETDRSCLDPVFDRIVTERNADVHTLFTEARNDWLQYKVFTQENIPNNQDILRIYTNRYDSEQVHE